MSHIAPARSSRNNPTRTARNAALLMLAISPILSFLPTAHAANLTWDPSHAGTSGSDAAGNWDLATAIWSNGASDTPWTNGNTAVFGVAAPATVTINTPGISAAGLTFNQGYTINATTGNTLALTGPVVATSGSATINAPITGTTGLSLSGAGSLTLGGVNTYSGGTTINGTLLVAATGNLGAANNSLTFGTTNTATVGNLTLNANATVGSIFSATNAGTNTVTLNNGATLTDTGALTLSLNLAAGGASNTSLVFNTDGSNTTLILGGPNNANLNLGGHSNGVAAGNMIGLLNLANVSNFIYNTGTTGTGQFQVGFGTRSQGQFIGATNNSITAALVAVGDSAAAPNGDNGNNNSGGNSNLALGVGNNTINAARILIGNGKAGGVLTFASTTAGTLTIAGQTGGASTTDISVGNAAINGGNNTSGSNLSLAGHNVTAQVGNLSVSTYAGAGSASTVPGGVSFDTGTFNVANLSIANNSGAGTSVAGPNGSVTIGTSAASTGVFSVSNSFLLANNTNTGVNATANGNFTLNGGTVNTSVDILRVGKSNTTFTMNGGNLSMNGHNLGSVAAPLTTINLAAGNVTNISTIAGSNITLGAALTLSGNNNFFIVGGGTLNSALAPLTISGAGSGISGGGATAATINGSVSLGAGATLSPGTAALASTLQFNNDLTLGNGSMVAFKLAAAPGPGSDLINVAGNLSLSGTVALNLAALGSSLTVGSNYTLFTYTGALTGNETNLSVPNIGARTTYSVVPTATTPNSIQLTIGGAPSLSLTYIGPVNSNWNLQGDTNFNDTSSNPQKFFNLDTVTFDDTSPNNNPVQIVGNLQPGAVTVNAARNYTFAGSGSISGTIGLTKSGPGTLTITNTNTYSGGTTINGGTLSLGNGGTSGSVAGSITNNALLIINRSDSLTFSNPISGAGNLSISSGGTVTMSAGSSYTGSTAINTGTTKIVGGTSLGATTSIANVTIANGATLDLGGDTTVNDGALANTRVYHVAGTGVGGLGSIINTGVSQFSAFSFITLDADTTFSGFRFDIGRSNTSSSTLDLQGHTLTLNMDAASSSLFAMLNRANVTAGNIIVNTGGTTMETTANILADATNSTITYNPGTKAMFYQTAPGDGVTTGVSRPMIFKGNNFIGSGNTTVAEIRSPMTLNGSITFEPMQNGVLTDASNNPLKIDGNITESGGSFTVNKLGVNTTTLAGAANSWSGAGTLDAGTLEFASNAAAGNSNSSIGAYAGNGTLTVDATAAVTSGSLRLAALNVNGALKIKTSAGASKANVTIAGSTGNWTGGIDLSNNKLVVEDASANHAVTAAAAQDQVLFGKTHAAGLFTTATLPANYALASVDNAALAIPKTTFGGVPVDAGSILVGPQLLGDANIDGHVDLSDLAAVLNNFNQPIGAWTAGNFDGATNIDLADLNDVLNNFGATNPDMLGSGGGSIISSAPTPEPASLMLLSLGAAALLTRRKHA